MLLNEIEDINTPLSQAFRVLKQNGQFIFSVTNPAWDLYIYAQEMAGIKSRKVIGLKGYFHRGPAKYIMGSDSNTNPDLAKKYKQEFEVEHYQRPVSDYVNTLISAGFKVKAMVEPEFTPEFLDDNPRFATLKDVPVGLILISVKE